MKDIKKTKGVKSTKLASLSISHSCKSRRNRVFTYENVPGVFAVGTIHDYKINLTYWTQHPSTRVGGESARFQIYYSANQADTYTTNFENVQSLIYKRYHINVYCYNEVAKKLSKQVKEPRRSLWHLLKERASRVFPFFRNAA